MVLRVNAISNLSIEGLQRLVDDEEGMGHLVDEACRTVEETNKRWQLFKGRPGELANAVGHFRNALGPGLSEEYEEIPVYRSMSTLGVGGRVVDRADQGFQDFLSKYFTRGFVEALTEEKRQIFKQALKSLVQRYGFEKTLSVAFELVSRMQGYAQPGHSHETEMMLQQIREQPLARHC